MLQNTLASKYVVVTLHHALVSLGDAEIFANDWKSIRRACPDEALWLGSIELPRLRPLLIYPLLRSVVFIVDEDRLRAFKAVVQSREINGASMVKGELPFHGAPPRGMPNMEV